MSSRWLVRNAMGGAAVLALTLTAPANAGGPWLARPVASPCVLDIVDPLMFDMSADEDEWEDAASPPLRRVAVAVGVPILVVGALTCGLVGVVLTALSLPYRARRPRR